MLLDRINLNHVRIFESVYRHRSMTLAARELHLTQSGISQHVKAMEDALGTVLFDRVKQRLIPTRASTELFKNCELGLGAIEAGISQIISGGETPSGVVAIGMPIEFGNNVVLPALADFAAANALVTFRFRYDFASKLNEMLLAGELDFAFVDQFRMDPAIKTERVFDETLELCISPARFAAAGAYRNQKKYYESIEFVDYQEGEPLLRMWFGHHLGTKSVQCNVRATLMDVQGIARLVKRGVGAGILPDHLITKLAEEGKPLHRFRGCGQPLKNTISVAYLETRTQSVAAQRALEHLKLKMKTSGRRS